jgi:hypothetical protein
MKGRRRKEEKRVRLWAEDEGAYAWGGTCRNHGRPRDRLEAWMRVLWRCCHGILGPVGCIKDEMESRGTAEKPQLFSEAMQEHREFRMRACRT